ncbi:MAG: cysteine--tRNA ligase, partial [Smithellaceae bacterium]|nr:cysteine--tRNA ligase [Smithellaceae bacterium]
ILVDGRKMSRSLNNAVTIAHLKEKGYRGRDIRFFLLGMNYRKPITYSEQALKMARNTVKKIDTFIYRLQVVDNQTQNDPDVDQTIYDLHHDFEKALDDDINISGALAALFGFIGKINVHLANGRISGPDVRKIIKALETINEILGIMDVGEQTLHRDVAELVQRRDAARKAGNWQEADSLRNRLSALGVEVLDSHQGTIWRFK